MVTQQDLDKAEAVVVEAEDELTRAERHHAVVGSEQAGALAYYAKHQADGARDVLRKLRARWDAEGAARAARTAAEEAFAPDAGAMAAKLAAARDEAAEAVAQAQAAVGRLLDVVGGYDVTVAAASRELMARGLRAEGGELVGGTPAGGVRLNGELWQPVGAADLLAAVMAAAVGARDQKHPLAALRWQHSGGLPTRTARDELVRRAAR